MSQTNQEDAGVILQNNMLLACMFDTLEKEAGVVPQTEEVAEKLAFLGISLLQEHEQQQAARQDGLSALISKAAAAKGFKAAPTAPEALPSGGHIAQLAKTARADPKVDQALRALYAQLSG